MLERNIPPMEKDQSQEPDIQCEIVNDLGTISEYNSWEKKFAQVSWNEHNPKYDIRLWNKKTTNPGKGLTFSEKELRRLKELIDAEIEYLDKKSI